MRKTVLAWVLLGCVPLAHGQQALPGGGQGNPAGPAAGGDAEARYLQLLEAASRLEGAGQRQEAEGVRRQAEQQRQVLLADLERLQASVDRLRRVTGTTREVQIRVRVMEFSRTKLRALGFDFAKIEGDEAAGEEPASYRFRLVDDAGPLLGVLEALRQEKLLTVLSEPTLGTVSGRRAFYKTGTEFPVPAPTKNGTVAIEYMHAGTQVDLTPIVLGRQTIRLSGRVRASEIEAGHELRIGENTMPSLRVREMHVGVEMQSGQTLAISGLAQKRVRAARHKPSLLGDLPGVGNLLARTEKQSDEVEMLILITPQVVPAASPGGRSADPRSAQAPLGLQYDLRR